MSEEQELNKARDFIDKDDRGQASKILWKLYQSPNLKIKLDSILSLLVVLDHLTENEKLLKVVEGGLKTASLLGKKDVEAYLLIEKCNFLLSKSGFMLYRQKNLKLSAGVFKWIDFSTEREKNEFKAIAKQRQEIEEDVQKLEAMIFDVLKIIKDHYIRGNIFLKLGDLHSSRFLNNKLELMTGGKIKSKIGNIYFVRRWNLDKWLLYKSSDRKKINDDWNKCVHFFKLAISEFKAGKNDVEMAHACYNLAVKYNLAFKFSKANNFLDQSQELAEKHNEKRLLSKIALLRKELAGRNKNVRNYVEEYGLDLP